MFRDYNRALVLEHPRISQNAREAHAEMLSLSSLKKLNVRFPTFLLSYFLYSDNRQFGNEFPVVATHGTLDGFVGKQTFQSLLSCAIVRIAKDF